MARHPDDNIDASTSSRSLNTRREEGDPPTLLASPITTGFSPLQGGTLDDVLSLPDPADTLDRLPGGKRRRK